MKPFRSWLALEGALGRFSAAVLDGENAVAEALPGKQALERGLSVVDEALARAGLRLGDLDALAVGTGPGSFTGLRIAVSYAKGLSLALGRPLVGVSSYDLLEQRPVALPILAVVPGRVGIACVRLRTTSGTWIRCGSYGVAVELVAAHLAPGELAVCGAMEGVAARLGERGFTVRALPFPDSPALAAARIAARRLAGGSSESSPHDVRPDYGELSAAEVRRTAQP